MAFEADWEVSTVLDAICVASTFRFLVPGEFFAAFEMKSSATAPRRLEASGRGGRFGAANSKFEIRNSKSLRPSRMPRFTGTGMIAP